MAPVKKEPKFIEYMCRNCGKKETHSIRVGRPNPGTCPRMKGRAHSWVINRKF